MAENKKDYMSPSRTYEFKLQVGTDDKDKESDLTPDLISVTISTSLELPYQSFMLNLSLPISEILIKRIYGQEPIRLTYTLFGMGDSLPQDQIVFELMYLSGEIPIDSTIPIDEDKQQREPQAVEITCLARKAYTIMNTFVNTVYQGNSIGNIIDDLVSKTEGSLNIDSQDLNPTIFDQVLVPGSTLYRNLKYLDRTFGIYNGMAGIYCTHDGNVMIKNLTNKIKSEQFIIYQLALGQENSQEIIEKCNDGIRFYTYKKIHTRYRGNSVFAYTAPIMKHVVKPKDQLYYTITSNLETLSKKYGLISKGGDIFFDSKAITEKSRIGTHKDHTGYEKTDTFINAKYSRRVSALAEMVVSLERTMKITNLMNIGEGMKLDTGADVTIDYTGAYILKASQLFFTKGRDWEASANLYLMRTNRTIS